MLWELYIKLTFLGIKKTRFHGSLVVLEVTVLLGLLVLLDTLRLSTLEFYEPLYVGTHRGHCNLDIALFIYNAIELFPNVLMCIPRRLPYKAEPTK